MFRSRYAIRQLRKIDLSMPPFLALLLSVFAYPKCCAANIVERTRPSYTLSVIMLIVAQSVLCIVANIFYTLTK